jgi:hypothetical protein
VTENPCDIKRLVVEALLEQLNLCRKNTTFRSRQGIYEVDTATKEMAVAIIANLAEIANDCGKQCRDAGNCDEVQADG